MSDGSPDGPRGADGDAARGRRDARDDPDVRDDRDGRGPRVDVPAVIRGAVVAMAVFIPLALVQPLAPEDSLLRPLLVAAILVGFGLGGAAAARVARVNPLTAGGLAAMAGFLIPRLVNIAVQALRGESPVWIGLPPVVLIATACGLLGAWLQLARTAHRARRDGRHAGDGQEGTRP